MTTSDTDYNEFFEVPKNWDGEKDIEFVKDEFGELDNYYNEMVWKIVKMREAAIADLKSAYDYFATHTPVSGSAYPLTAEEEHSAEWMVVRILQLVASRSDDQRYKDRFASWADMFLVALQKYELLLESRNLAGGYTWLYSLMQLLDLVGAAALELLEAMAGEHDDYYEPYD